MYMYYITVWMLQFIISSCLSMEYSAQTRQVWYIIFDMKQNTLVPGSHK